MINKENMKKPQRDLFDFLENIIKKKYNNLVLECFLKFSNKTIFEKTMKRIFKGQDEFDCDEYSLNLKKIEFIISELQKLKKKKKKKTEKKLKKVGEKCTKDEECKGKGCCDKGKCEKGNKKVCKNKGKPEKKKPMKKNKLTEEDCKQWEKNKKKIKNDKIINIKNGKPIKYTKKNGDLTKKVNDIDKECEKIMKKSHYKSQIPKKKSPHLKKTPILIYEELYDDEEECKKDDHCKSKCCKDNKCVNNEICKVEKKIIYFIKNLTNKVGKINDEQIQIRYLKLEVKINKYYKNEIPREVENHLKLLKEKILNDPTPSPESSSSNKYIKLLDSYEAGNLNEYILEKIIKKYKIEIDISDQYEDTDDEEPNIYEKMIAISENKKAFNDKKIQNIINKNINNSNTFEEEIREKNKSLTPSVKSLTPSVKSLTPSVKSLTPSKNKLSEKSYKKISNDLKNNKLNQKDMDKILKNLNLKTQKEYLKDLILIGLNKI